MDVTKQRSATGGSSRAACSLPWIDEAAVRPGAEFAGVDQRNSERATGTYCSGNPAPLAACHAILPLASCWGPTRLPAATSCWTLAEHDLTSVEFRRTYLGLRKSLHWLQRELGDSAPRQMERDKQKAKASRPYGVQRFSLDLERSWSQTTSRAP
ncbi:hypothetical protein EJB05_29989, partial [Eragrostis curvula]